MFKCAGPTAAVDGVTVDLMQDVLAAYMKQEGERRAPSQTGKSQPAGARRPSMVKGVGLPSSPIKAIRRASVKGRDKDKDTLDYSKYDLRSSLIASKLIRPMTKGQDQSYAQLLLKSSAAAAAAQLPGSASGVGRASVYLAIAPQTDFHDALDAVRALGRGGGTFFYLDILCIDLWAEGLEHIVNDLTEAQNKLESKVVQAVNAAERTFDRDGVTAEAKRTARLKEKQERRAAEARERYYEKDFDDALFACREAVFVLSLVDDSGEISYSMYDMQFLYSLYLAKKASPRVKLTLRLVPSDEPQLKAMLLDDEARAYLLQMLRTLTFGNTTPRSVAERTAILNAIGTDEQIEAADRTVYMSLLEFVFEFGWALVQSCVRELESKRTLKVGRASVDREDVFKLWRAMIYIEVELDRVDAALKRTREMVAFVAAGYGEEHELTLDASNTLANMLRRKGGEANQREAIGIYEKLIELSNSFALSDLVSSNRNERSLGAQMQLANALRDHGDHAQATPHYRDVLKRSRDKLGDEHLNTAYAQMALANNLRVRIDTADRQTLAALASELVDTAVESHADPQTALLHHARSLYVEAEEVLRKEYKSVHPMTIAARLNSVVLSIDLAKTTPTYAVDAQAALDDLRTDCVDQYGELHELSAYVCAKQGELKYRFGQAPSERAAGKAQMGEAKKMYEALKLPDTHPRVQEIKARMHMRPEGVARNPTMSMALTRRAKTGAA